MRQVWWDAPERGSKKLADEAAWVAHQLELAAEAYAGRILVVAKSLGTLAAARAAARKYEAAWLTPLLTEPDAAQPLLSYPASQFTLIDSADPFLVRDVLARLPGERLLVPGDHVLRVSGDPVATVEAHQQFVRSFDAWIRHLQS